MTNYEMFKNTITLNKDDIVAILSRDDALGERACRWYSKQNGFECPYDVEDEQDAGDICYFYCRGCDKVFKMWLDAEFEA